MLIQKSYKTELDPTNKDITLFVKGSGVSRFTYNWGLQRRIDEYQKTGKSSNSVEQHKELNQLKQTDFPWMYEVSKCCAQEALRNLDKAFDNFRRRVKDKSCKNKGFPKFKSKKNGLGSFQLNGQITIKSDSINLPRIGWVKLKESGYLPTNKKITNNVTISEKAGRWYVSVNVEEEIQVPENNGPIIGIDLGLTSFITDNGGNKILPPKPLNKSLRRLQKLQRQHSKKQKGSKNREKSRKKLAKLHQHIANQRKDFLHNLTTTLTKTKSVIAIENLKVSNMIKNHSLARHIQDVGWYEFTRQLEYKSQWYGSKIVKVPTFYPSTKLCSNCGCKKKTMSLSERTYECLMCDLEMDRDINAAINIKNYYLNLDLNSKTNTVSSTEIQACGEDCNSTKQELDIKSNLLDLNRF